MISFVPSPARSELVFRCEVIRQIVGVLREAPPLMIAAFNYSSPWLFQGEGGWGFLLTTVAQSISA